MNFKKPALNYSGRKLTEFPEEIFSGARVYKLNLSHNHIKHIPKEIAELQHLETLNLSGNKIRHLLAKLFDLPNLKILILNNNEIVNLPRQIEKLQKLKTLHLANNKLSSLPMEMSRLPNLEKLNVAGNFLDNLPLNSNDLFPKLRSLWIGQNPLRNFISAVLLNSMPKLKSVYCYSPKLPNRILCKDHGILSGSAVQGNCIDELKVDYSSIDYTDISPGLRSGLHFPAIVQYPKPNNLFSGQDKKKSTIFISYAHNDREYLDRLKIHLKVLGRGIAFEVWDDTRIRTSDKWQDEIAIALDKASDAILLISTDFLASDFINDNELPPLLEAAKQKGTRIHPVIVHPCQFLKFKSLCQFQAANSPDEALSECLPAKQERIWMKLCNNIQHFLEQ